MSGYRGTNTAEMSGYRGRILLTCPVHRYEYCRNVWVQSRNTAGMSGSRERNNAGMSGYQVRIQQKCPGPDEEMLQKCLGPEEGILQKRPGPQIKYCKNVRVQR